MTGLAETGRSAAGWPEGEGRLPFALRVGVTGTARYPTRTR